MRVKDRYEYDPAADLVGKGGFARVFRAQDTLLNREVALKVFTQSDRDQGSVLQEIRKAIQLEHPNLLRYYDVVLLEQSNALGEQEQLQIGIMEYANAGDLKVFARANPKSPDVKRFLREVLHGLDYLHNHGIIHRDLKAQNILLVDRGGKLTAKISDFGISKSMSSDDTRSSSMLVGTIEYMAPEQFNPKKFGIEGKVRPNVDLWGFGVMVHELLTDATPFGKRGGETTAEQIMASILSPDLPEDIEKLPEPFRTVVKMCLVPHAKDRVQKASELLPFLEEGYVAGEKPKPKGKTAPVSVDVPADATRMFSPISDSGASDASAGAQNTAAFDRQALIGSGDDDADAGSGTVIFNADRHQTGSDTASWDKSSGTEAVGLSDNDYSGGGDGGYSEPADDKPFWKKYIGVAVALLAVAFLGFAAYRTMNSDDDATSTATESAEVAGDEKTKAADGEPAKAEVPATETAKQAGEAAAAAGAAAAAAAAAEKQKAPAKTADKQKQAPVCEQVCTMVPGKTITTGGGTTTVNAGEFSYPAGSGVPQGQARNIASAACKGGSLVSFNATPDGQCGGGICFAKVRATCSTSRTTTGPPTQKCERVCR
jgi:serine/threonine protein kinase